MLILASASPRRHDLLKQAGYAFDVDPAHVDETRRPNEPPADYVQRVALEKARVTARRNEAAVVLAADTIVVFEGQLMAKPTSPEDAARMLRTLSCGTHQVHTAVVVLSRGKELVHVETTDVTFLEIPAAELTAYVRSGDPMDKAGAYGIQGYAARWIPRIDGDFFNVMGLPISATVDLLAQTGVSAIAPRSENVWADSPAPASISEPEESVRPATNHKSLIDVILG